MSSSPPPSRPLLVAHRAGNQIATLRAAEAAGVDLARPVVTSCGSGITAAILNLALHRMGHTRNALYDGSWVEWGAYPDLAVETG